MFFVFHKSKIYSYLIALSMVVILFVAASKIDNMVSENRVLETSSNIIKTNEIESNSIDDKTNKINEIQQKNSINE